MRLHPVIIALSCIALAPSASAQKVIPDPGRVYAGLYNIGTVESNYAEVTALSQERPPGIVFTFHDWNSAGIKAPSPILQTLRDPLEGEDVTLSPLGFAEQIAPDGAVLALAWDAIGYIVEHPDYWTTGAEPPVTWADVFSGVYDDYIRNVANEIKDFGQPIMLSPAGEFNTIGAFAFGPLGNQYFLSVDDDDLTGWYGDPAIPDGPERVRDLYHYVIDVFRDEDVTNVTWFMYSNSAYMNPQDLDPDELPFLDTLHPRHFYPGDDYVDWIGGSAYVSNDDPDIDLDFTTSHALAAFRQVTQQPYFIPEFGVTDAEGDSRASRMGTLFRDELPAMPDIRAWTFADGELMALVFDIPRLGAGAGETAVWNDQVFDSGRYTNELVFSPTLPGDFDGDGDVDAGDLAHMLASWGAPGGDLDGDGVTTGADLAILLASWGTADE